MNDLTCNCEICELKDIFLKHASTSDVENICNIKVEKEYKSGEIIVNQGEEINDFSYLKKGLVKLFRLGSTGKEQIISIAKPLDFVNLLSIFSDKYYNYSVSAIADSIICSIKLDEVKRLILGNGRFAFSIIEKMSRTSDKIIIDSLEIKQRQVFGRVAYILLFFSNYIFSGNLFELPVTRKEIAEITGMTTENIIRTMSTFRKDSIIRINGKTIEILDKARLLKISEVS